ncbi:Zinc-finger homeodomain protein [Quillaja saponaria]|uniref:Zinc-finger homeodomain protein n=1 Tax=Quillaja saponaria TaxID=32244 RepID=A0AAD7P9H3_QUISA|nr:Zinc-finger homeodomain protein [Quillaja saponaria]
MPNMFDLNVVPTTFEHLIVYKECTHNYAASLGRFAFDGCRQFLQASEDVHLCVGCGCHRNFHRKDVVYKPIIMPSNKFVVNSETETVVPQLSNGEKTVEVDNTVMEQRKRKKRIVYTKEQRNKLKRFAEKLGWKPQKHDKEEVEQFCLEMGMSRRVFKLWLYNNKRWKMEKSESSSA